VNTDEVRKIVRLVITALTTGISTAATAYIASAQTGSVSATQKTIAILGGVVAMCSTITSGLSGAPGEKK
jgi:uncharacterized membrane protein